MHAWCDTDVTSQEGHQMAHLHCCRHVPALPRVSISIENNDQKLEIPEEDGDAYFLFLWDAFDTLLKMLPGHTIFNLCASKGCSWDSPMGIDPWTRSWLVTAYVWSWKLPCWGQYNAVGCVTWQGGVRLDRRGLGLALTGVCCSLCAVCTLRCAPFLSARAEGFCCWILFSNSCRSKCIMHWLL